MVISLKLVQLDHLRALASGEVEVDGIRCADGALPPEFLMRLALENLAAGHDPLWWSFFLLVEEPERLAVGSGGFKGQPQEGRVEIGYGVAPAHRGRGVATAGTEALVELAFTQPEIAEVFAETSVENIASRRVVEKAGFHPVGQRNSPTDGLLDQWLIHR